MNTRRELLKGLGLGAAWSILPMGFVAEAAAVIPKKGRIDESAAESAPGVTEAMPWDLLAPLGRNQPIGLGWSIHDVEPVRNGSAAVLLRHETGRVERIGICRNAPGAGGVAQSRFLDFFHFSPTGEGQATEESLGRALIGMAASLDRADYQQEPPHQLMTFCERRGAIGFRA